MSAHQPSPLRELWYKWKALRLPWRRVWLAGRDLSGITFWESRPDISSRTRRIASYPRSTSYADVSITPAWTMWLKHTRPDAPTLLEQTHEVTRQSNLKQLAAAADKRWAEKPSFLDKPQDTGQVAPQLKPKDLGVDVDQTERDEQEGVSSAVKTAEEVKEIIRGEGVNQGRFERSTRERLRERENMENPWKEARGGPSVGWQPRAWMPGQAGQRR